MYVFWITSTAIYTQSQFLYNYRFKPLTDGKSLLTSKNCVYESEVEQYCLHPWVCGLAWIQAELVLHDIVDRNITTFSNQYHKDVHVYTLSTVSEHVKTQGPGIPNHMS